MTNGSLMKVESIEECSKCNTLTLIVSYIRKQGHFRGVQNLNFNIFVGFQKNEYFGGMQILWIFWAVITKVD